MKKISLAEFARLIREDEALSARIAACTDRDGASRTLSELAEELGYELYSERPTGKQAVSDDDLSEVAGGRNILTGPNSGVLYPYSWFVTIGDGYFRKLWYERLVERGLRRINVIDRTAVISACFTICMKKAS